MGSDLEREFPHATRGLLRALVATIDQEMSRSLGPAESVKNLSTDELRSSWAKLVELLALGPAPEFRECPVCQHIGMRDATRCGYCWTKLSPLTSVPSCEEDAPAPSL